jgi:hypothetical protein
MQAILRVVILALIPAYMGADYAPNAFNAVGGSDVFLVLKGLGAFLGIAFTIFLAICIFPAPSAIRRTIGLLVDVAAATLCMFLAGEAGALATASVMGVHPNDLSIRALGGIRRGLAVGTLLARTPSHRLVLDGLIDGLAALRFDVARRVQEARSRVEEALKNCIERHRKGRRFASLVSHGRKDCQC